MQGPAQGCYYLMFLLPRLLRYQSWCRVPPASAAPHEARLWPPCSQGLATYSVKPAPGYEQNDGQKGGSKGLLYSGTCFVSGGQHEMLAGHG